MFDVDECGEPTGTREEILQYAIFSASGLITTFCIWGIVQERMLTQPYNGEYFHYTYGLVLFSRLGGFFASLFLLYYFKIERTVTALWEMSFPSVANMLSSWCQYESLKYLSFPAVMMAKAFKMAVEAGRMAYEAKLAPIKKEAEASSPLTSFLS